MEIKIQNSKFKDSKIFIIGLFKNKKAVKLEANGQDQNEVKNDL